MKKFQQIFIDWWDPHHQSFLFFKWSIPAILGVVLGTVFLTVYWKGALAHTLLDNVFVYLPNYLTHEMAGHNFVGNFFYQILPNEAVGRWIATLAGNGVETLVPLVVCWLILRLEGGRWALPPALYWLSTTVYGAGVYAQDARACSMALTSSDMVTNWKPGERCGDWHDILEPIGLLNYDQVVAYTFFMIGGFLFMIALYSAWYYWTHPNFYDSEKKPQPVTLPEDNWQPPNVYDPQSFANDQGPKTRQ